jgi:ABC-type branched-subunit amino acid transport system ATPase component
MERSATKGGKCKADAQAEREIVKAAYGYAEALKASIEFPSPESTQRVLEMARALMLRAALLMPQETMRKLSATEQDRIMKNE